MVEPKKPFACTVPDCGMTFTNEDHLNVHTKKHDMVLQFGSEQKAAVFVADQTPTPTRFIRNCEEVGLFQDLQNVNPFDEGFKRAIETKQGILSLEHACTSTEELHTPQMFPILDTTESVFSTTNNQRCVTISRSSSDENGAIKEFETTRISKLTNEVTTISRIVEKHDDTPKAKDNLQKNSVSYTNNVIKIQSNVEITKDIEDTVIKDTNLKDGVYTKDVVFTKDCIYTKDSSNKDVIFCPSSKDNYDRIHIDGPPIMSQKSIDLVVDSLTSDYVTDNTVKNDISRTKDSNVVIKDVRHVKSATKDNKNVKKDVSSDDRIKEKYEVTLKLPSGQQIKLVSSEEEKPTNTKDLLKKVLTEKVETQKILSNLTVPIVPTIIPAINTGTLIPVSIVKANITNYIPKLPLKVFDKKAIKRKSSDDTNCVKSNGTEPDQSGTNRVSSTNNSTKTKHNVSDLDSRSAASRRYRAKLKTTMTQQSLENKQLKETNVRLAAEMAALQTLIIDHVRRCHTTEDLRELQEKICRIRSKD